MTRVYYDPNNQKQPRTRQWFAVARKYWLFAAGAAVGVLAIGALCAVAAVVLMRRGPEPGELLDEAGRAFDNGLWIPAKNLYRAYLQEHPNDVDVLSKYSEACLRITSNRRSALSAAVKAKFKIAVQTGDRLAQDRVAELCFRYEFWRDLESCVDHFSIERPDDEGLRYCKAAAADGLGRVNGAIGLYEDLIDADTDRIEAYGRLARLLRENTFAHQAVAVLDEAAARFPDDARVYRERARYFLDAGDGALAREEAEAALTREPANADGLALAARAELAMGAWADAAAFGERAVAGSPSHVEACLALAEAYERLGEGGKAADMLDGTDPMVRVDNPDLMLKVAEARLAVNRFEDAREAIEAYRKAYPKHFVALDYLAARELLAKGLAGAAAERFTAVVESDPGYGRARFLMAVALAEAGDETRARQALEAYLDGSPLDERARVFMEVLSERGRGGRTGRDAGGTSEAGELARVVMRNVESGPESLVRVARVLTELGNKEGLPEDIGEMVVGMLDRAVLSGPSSGAYGALVAFYLVAGDIEAARGVVARADEAGVARERMAEMEAAVAGE